MTDNPIERMRELVEAKKQKSAGRSGLAKPEKVINAANKRVRKQYKKGGMFDGK